MYYSWMVQCDVDNPRSHDDGEGVPCVYYDMEDGIFPDMRAVVAHSTANMRSDPDIAYVEVLRGTLADFAVMEASPRYVNIDEEPEPI